MGLLQPRMYVSVRFVQLFSGVFELIRAWREGGKRGASAVGLVNQQCDSAASTPEQGCKRKGPGALNSTSDAGEGRRRGSLLQRASARHLFFVLWCKAAAS